MLADGATWRVNATGIPHARACLRAVRQFAITSVGIVLECFRAAREFVVQIDQYERGHIAPTLPELPEVDDRVHEAVLPPTGGSLPGSMNAQARLVHANGPQA